MNKTATTIPRPWKYAIRNQNQNSNIYILKSY